MDLKITVRLVGSTKSVKNYATIIRSMIGWSASMVRPTDVDVFVEQSDDEQTQALHRENEILLRYAKRLESELLKGGPLGVASVTAIRNECGLD